MKTVILIRHAKSDWTDGSISDHDRPLNNRGKHDAPEMAKRLIKNNISIDAFYTSTALRAMSTANLIAGIMNEKQMPIFPKPELYLAGVNIFQNLLSEIDNAFNSIAIVAHNPGITQFANSLTDARVDDLPTGSFFAVKSDIVDWQYFNNSIKKFFCFSYPKNEKIIWS